MQALYDFDGTITSRDTTILLLVEFLKLSPFRIFKLIWLLFRMVVAGTNLLKQEYKNKAVGCLIKDLNDSQLHQALIAYKRKVELIYRPCVIESVKNDIQNNLMVIIMTASPSFAISTCLSDLPILVIGTEFEKIDNRYTGHLKGNNCYGVEKVNRLYKWAKLNNVQLNVLSAWSDHISDFDMVRLSAKRYWIGGDELQKQIMNIDPEANFVNVKSN